MSVWQVSHAQSIKFNTNLTGLFVIHIVSNWAVLKTRIMFNKNEKIPSRGYKVPSGFGWDYRATAIAYLEREGLFTIGHANGNYYTLTQLKNARVG